MRNEDLPPGLRASDADREATAERLRVASVEGRLDPYELDERLSAAFSAKYCGELSRLTADITLPPPPPPAPVCRPVFVTQPRSTSGYAVASVILGLTWLWWLGSLGAIFFGHIALRRIAASGGRQGGRGLAITGLALGYFGALMLFFTLAAVAVA